MPISAIGGVQPQTTYLSAVAHTPGADHDRVANGTEAGRFRPQESEAGNKDREYSEEQLAQIQELKARDQAVRQHEAAHQAAGGALAGSASFSYERGPDGQLYAIGGEVSIDMSTVSGNPQATIDKMRTVRAAATAPSDPSSQDRAIAAQAMAMMIKAQQELLQETSKPQESSGPTDYARQQGIAAYQLQA
ncbi:putative metalloprotease CJM1_0395 family protein [Castellaniella sp.]|uniref:putative metalloprotease CJM1_0395 family protein n=1 Tax=Castellaniella sp. TaxID=1955812 RepID=UPI002AFE64B6|nr:putative metalloprotease CJM1_0395 family protein [Castellaniella sp.]